MYKSLPETPDTQTRQRAARGRESVFFFLISRPAAISTRSNFPVHSQKKPHFWKFPIVVAVVQ